MSALFLNNHPGRFVHTLRMLPMVVSLFLFSSSVLPGQQANLLPRETVAAISIHRSTDVSNNWKRSGLYHLCNHDSLVKFFADLRDKSLRQTDSSILISKLNFGELWELVEGNATFALIERNESTQGLIVANIGENNDKTIQWLERIEKNIASGGATKRTSKTTGVSVVSYALEKSAERSFEGFSYAINDKLLVIATSDSEVRETFSRINESSRETLLSSDPAFVDSTAKVQSEFARANMWWFVRPIELGKLAVPARSNAKNQQPSFFDFVSEEGYDTLKSAGGIGRLNPDGSITMIANVIAKRPFRRSMRMLEFKNEIELSPPKWVSQDFSSSAAFAVKFDRMLNNFSSLFDQLYGEGEEGVFESVLQDIHNDAKGPQVDLQNEIFLKIDGPLTMVSLRKPTKESVKVFAAHLSDAVSVTRAIGRLYEGDSQAEKIDDPTMDAWLIKPLENDPAPGQSRQAYVIAIRDGFVLLAPSVADIKQCFENKSKPLAGGTLYRGFRQFAKKELGESRCFEFFSRVEHLAEQKLTEIQQGRPTGVVGAAFDKLGWNEVLRKMDRSSFPALDELKELCHGNVGIAGKATENGWRVIFELTSHRAKK